MTRRILQVALAVTVGTLAGMTAGSLIEGRPFWAVLFAAEAILGFVILRDMS